jgi:hypothetical protein
VPAKPTRGCQWLATTPKPAGAGRSFHAPISCLGSSIFGSASPCALRDETAKPVPTGLRQSQSFSGAPDFRSTPP